MSNPTAYAIGSVEIFVAESGIVVPLDGQAAISLEGRSSGPVAVSVCVPMNVPYLYELYLL